ncbi:MAG: GNAT family N-acetyltransferase [Roseobacter sp.]
MTVRNMTFSELEIVLSWAAQEGWNPGHEDAVAFFAADPEGFFVKEVSGNIVAAVSVVNHDPNHAFLGLYICRPDYRGLGYGFDVWQAAKAHAGTRCIGLDGVPDQQENYARDGFTRHGQTTRFEGLPEPVQAENVEVASPLDFDRLVEMDLSATGHARRLFLAAWFTQTPDRQTIVVRRDSKIAAFATVRKCQLGVKVGPLHAGDLGDVQTLLAAAAQFSDGPVYVDVPDPQSALQSYLLSAGFSAVFETARMYNAVPPVQNSCKFHAVATLELG